ncbi:MAG TPA: YCF48-related protein [Ignavibacteriaceae bacterium]|nr:YCF48-related protein [Ignavibacteriaceae bacterium]
MRTLKISLLVFILSITMPAQEGWFWQNPLPQGNNLESICSADSNTLFAVGWYGIIIKSTDGGDNWIVQQSGTINQLNGVSFTNSELGIAVGTNGTMIKTTNGGGYWFNLTIGSEESLYSVKFVDENIVYAVGEAGTILKSTNSGLTWIFLTSGTTDDLLDLCFTDVNVGNVVGGSGKFLRTIDGGINWTQIDFGTSALKGVYFYDSNLGIIVGTNGTIFRTIDGGLNWSWQGLAARYVFEDVFLINESLGIIAGWDIGTQDGTVLRTTNGGTTWSFANIGEVKSFFMSVSLTSENSECIVGWEGIVIKSTDFGENWIEKSSGTRMPLDAIFFSDELHGTAVGEYGANNTILRTNDGGLHWYEQNSNSSGGLKRRFFY